jgi:hypothetical protein
MWNGDDFIKKNLIICTLNLTKLKNRNSSVGIATQYGLDDRMIGVRFPEGAGNFSLRHRVQTGSGLPGALSLGVKWAWREAHHSPPSSAEVKECVELYLHSPYTSS